MLNVFNLVESIRTVVIGFRYSFVGPRNQPADLRRNKSTTYNKAFYFTSMSNKRYFRVSKNTSITKSLVYLLEPSAILYLIITCDIYLTIKNLYYYLTEIEYEILLFYTKFNPMHCLR